MSPAKRANGRTQSRAWTAVGGAGLRALRGITRQFDYVVIPETVPAGQAEAMRRANLLNAKRVTLVLDVGANAGQWAAEVRQAGYRGRIVSFEPLSSAFKKLRRTASHDPEWECRRIALSSEEGTAELNVASNSESSSLLAMEDLHLQAAPDSAYVKTEEVPTARLDAILGEVAGPDDKVFLKLDTQGYELEVLRGAEGSLDRILGIQAELSLVPLYKGAPLWKDVVEYLEERGYRLAGVEAGHEDPASGELIQIDGIFVRDEAGISPA